MTPPVPPLAHLLHRLAPDAGLIPDAELLRRFAEHRDEAAFELLVWRHGGLIWGVCRRVAPDRTAAEDAFQAAALALARHAAAIRRAPSVAGWLYRVAYRAALRTRLRRRPEPLPADRPGTEPDPADAAATRELAAAIDAEVGRLPEPFRDAFVLCELEGRSNAEAAAALGCAVGTVESRLTRARQKRRARLARRGLALPAGALVVAAAPPAAHAAAVRAARDPAAAPAAVRELAARAVPAGGPGALRAAVLVLVAGGAVALGVAVAAGPNPPAVPPSRESAAADPAEPTDPPAPAGPGVRRLGSGRFRHSGAVSHAAFSSDGARLAAAALGSVSVWEAKTGKLLRRVEQAHVPFQRVAFAPDDKALYAVAGPTRGGCDLLTLDPDTGKELGRVEITNVLYRGAEFSPDGARLAVYSIQIAGEAVLIDPKAGKELARVPAYFTGNAFTPDGKGLIVAGGAERVRVFDTTTGKEVELLARPNTERPQWVRFVPPGNALAASYNVVERWNLKRGERLWKTEGLLPQGTGLEVSPDGKRVAQVSSAVVLIDGETGKEVRPRKDLIWNCTAARFSPDSKALAVTTTSGTVVLWDAATGATLPQSADLPGIVSGLTFSADGKTLSALAGERWVRWDLAAAESRAEPLADFTVLAPGGRVGLQPDTFNYPDSDAEFVDPVTGKRTAKLDPPETGVTVVISRADYKLGLFSGDGTRYVGFRRTPRAPGAGQQELGVAVWDTATGKRVAQQAAEKEPFMLAAVSPDGKAVALHMIAGNKVRLAVWEPDADRVRWTRDLGTGRLFAAFADGGAKLVVQEYHVPLLLSGPAPPVPPGPYPFFVFDAATGKELAKADGPDLGAHPLVFTGDTAVPVANARAVSPDGKTLAVSGWDGTIHLWNAATDRETAKLAHPGPVHALAFGPGGKTLAAASLAAPVAVYDLSAPAPKP